jgi:PleD family two-component response regulator
MLRHSMTISSLPTVLIATADRRQAQELSDALVKGGFRVTQAHDEREAVDQAQIQPPDAIVVDSRIAPPGYALCRKLRAFGLATPVVLTNRDVVTRAQELEALRAGAWAVLSTPLDAESLALRLALFIEPKRELDRVSEERLVDRVSGLYNSSGLNLRSTELAELSTRHGLSLTCAVFRPAPLVPSQFADERIALTFKRLHRASDALGRTGTTEFALFAPATSTGAGARLVQRIIENVERAFTSPREGNKRVVVRAGYSAAPAAQTISPPALLARARSALEGIA